MRKKNYTNLHRNYIKSFCVKTLKLVKKKKKHSILENLKC